MILQLHMVRILVLIIKFSSVCALHIYINIFSRCHKATHLDHKPHTLASFFCDQGLVYINMHAQKYPNIRCMCVSSVCHLAGQLASRNIVYSLPRLGLQSHSLEYNQLPASLQQPYKSTLATYYRVFLGACKGDEQSSYIAGIL